MIKSPFKFLDSYTKEDRDIFFGRDREIEEMYQKMFESKILLVYGISGTGKTSIINCGLANEFEDSDWLPVKVRRGRNITESLVAELQKLAVTPPSPLTEKTGTLPPGGDTPTHIVKTLQSLYLDHFKPIYIVVDQFEELFIFGSKEEREEFIQIVKQVVDSDVQCRFIFSIREEYLAGVTEFERTIPDFLSNRMRIEKMTWTNAKQVIEEPCKVYGIKFEEGLAEIILGKLSPESTEVELTYLQVLLDKLYNLSIEVNKEEPEFTKDLLQQVGDVSDLLGGFLEDQITKLDDPDTGLVILKSFVSIKGTKRQVTTEDVSEFAKTFGEKISEEDLKDLIERFVTLRILRDKDASGRYELRHDSLATKIYEKISLYEKELLEVRQFLDNAYSSYEKRKVYLSLEDLKYVAPYEDKLFLNQRLIKFINDSRKEVQKRKRRRRNVVIAAGIMLVIVLFGFTFWALKERNKAVLGEKKAKANFYNFTANEVVEEDPTTAMRLAEYAYKLDSTSQAVKNNLRRIYYGNSFYKILIKHDDLVSSLAISPNNKTVLTSSYSFPYTAYLLNLEGNQIQEFTGHEGAISSIAFSPDGKTILTGSHDNTASLWDLEGNQIKVLRGHNEWVNDVAFSPDGKTVLTGSGDGTARLWDLKGNQLKVFKGYHEGITSVAFSPDGKTILTGSRDAFARLWDLEGNQLKVFKGHESAISSLVLSPSGKTILTGSYDNTARLWDLEGNQIVVFKGHKDFILSVAFSPDGKTVLTGSGDGTARLWDLKGNLLNTFKGHGGYIRSVIYSPDNTSIITAGDNTVRLWSLDGIKLDVLNVVDDDLYSSSIIHSNDGNLYMLCRGDSIFMLRDLEENLIQDFVGHNDKIKYVDLRPKSNHILSTSFDNTARIWDLKGNQICILSEPDHYPDLIQLSPNGKIVATTSCHKRIERGLLIITNTPEKLICLWDLKGKLIQIIKGEDTEITSITFSPDGKKFLTASSNGTICLLDLKGNELIKFRGHSSWINTITFSPDGGKILSGSDDKTARLWDLEGNQLQLFKGHGSYISSVAFSPDGKTILTGSYDNTARLWNLEGNELHVFTGLGDYNKAIFSPDGSKIVIISGQTAQLWDVKTPFKEFHAENFYEELSTTQKLTYNITNCNMILESDNEREIEEAANYYFTNANLMGNESIGYLNNAMTLYKKLLTESKKAKYYIDLLRIYLNLQELEPGNEYLPEKATIFKELHSFNEAYELLEGADYFFAEARGSEDDSLAVHYYSQAKSLYEKIMENFPDTDVNDDAFTCYNNLALAQLFEGQYSEALNNAEKGLELQKDEIIYTKLALANIFNNHYDEAESILKVHKDSIVNQITFSEYIIGKLQEFEESGVTHPDFEKVRELLEEK